MCACLLATCVVKKYSLTYYNTLQLIATLQLELTDAISHKMEALYELSCNLLIFLFKEIHIDSLQLTANRCNTLHYPGAVPKGMNALFEFIFELCQTGLQQDPDHRTATHCKAQVYY